MSRTDEIERIVREDNVAFLWRAAALGLLLGGIQLSFSPDKVAEISALALYQCAFYAKIRGFKSNRLPTEHEKEVYKNLEPLRTKMEIVSKELGIKPPPLLVEYFKERKGKTRLGCGVDVGGVIRPSVTFVWPFPEKLQPMQLFASAAHELIHIRVNSRAKILVLKFEKWMSLFLAARAFRNSLFFSTFPQALFRADDMAKHTFGSPSQETALAFVFGIKEVLAAVSPQTLVALSAFGTAFIVGNYLENSYARSNEFRADEGALLFLPKYQPLIGALDKIRELKKEMTLKSREHNFSTGTKMQQRKNWVLSRLFDDHPTREERFQRMVALAARNSSLKP